MQNERRRTVLSALISEYVASSQPVGSKVLVERYRLGCSPATVRNELAALEEDGLVYQPHTSAGRVPTDVGYRAFVDDVVERHTDTLPAGDVDAIHARYERVEHELTEVMRETATVLSALTDCAAVVAAPTLQRARIRRVSLVGLGPTRATLVVVTDSGQVANRSVEFDQPVDGDALAEVERYVDGALCDLMGTEVTLLRDRIEGVPGAEAGATLAILDEVIDCLVEADEDRVLTHGVTALLRQPEFTDADALRPVVALLEDSIMVLHVLSDVMQSRDVVVRIGAENRLDGLARMSFVAHHYGSGDAGGIVGVLGPTRMDYPRAMATVRTVASTLSEHLG
ncbi:MAG: heat-inducible transcriptional repressor HrcA [Coriobacteriia bacterium]